MKTLGDILELDMLFTFAISQYNWNVNFLGDYYHSENHWSCAMFNVIAGWQLATFLKNTIPWPSH